MIKVSESLNGAIENFLEVTPEVISHMADKDNPHAVTKEQIGLSALKNEEQATKAEFNGHKENKQNPHAVTKEQIGLSLVKNEEQATAAEFQAHISGEGNKHSAEHILYDDITLKEKIEILEEESGSGSKEEIENIKKELEKGSIILKGQVTTTTADTTTQLPFVGDERFVGRDGNLILPNGCAATFEISVVALVGDENGGTFAKGFSFRGAGMNYLGESYFVLYSGEYYPDSSAALPQIEGTRVYYAEAQFVDYFCGYGVYVIGDDVETLWQATVEIKNLTQI